MLLSVSRAPKKDAPWLPGLLTCGSSQRFTPSQAGSPSDLCIEAPLAAYSGGTVWDLHPLRVAAGVNVNLYVSPRPERPQRCGRMVE